MKKNIKIALFLALITAIYMLAGILINSMGGTLYLSWLFWNLFLAVLPTAFAMGAELFHHLLKRWNLISILFCLAWLLFLPNACYMVTDLIYIDTSSFVGADGTYLPHLEAWIELFYIVSGVFLALSAGLFSTSIIHRLLPFSSSWHNVWIGCISLLCGYGVYIGRFLRLNSWDILHPLMLIQKLTAHIDRFAVLFTLMIAGFYFIAYLIFDRIIQNENHKKQQTM